MRFRALILKVEETRVVDGWGGGGALGLREKEVTKMGNWVGGRAFNCDGEDWGRGGYGSQEEIKTGLVALELSCHVDIQVELSQR